VKFYHVFNDAASWDPAFNCNNTKKEVSSGCSCKACLAAHYGELPLVHSWLNELPKQAQHDRLSPSVLIPFLLVKRIQINGYREFEMKSAASGKGTAGKIMLVSCEIEHYAVNQIQSMFIKQL
jgi:hypothetical protein